MFRLPTTNGPVFELYDPAKHGVWELTPDVMGVMRPLLVAETSELLTAQYDAEKSDVFDATSEQDGRHKVVASIVQRRGQPKFRRELMAAYGERCAVTDCPVTEILEAAHIRPYRGVHTNHVNNGILLRADVHTLFDLGLMRISPGTWKIEIAARARRGYEQYHQQLFRLPLLDSLRPALAALAMHYE